MFDNPEPAAFRTEPHKYGNHGRPAIRPTLSIPCLALLLGLGTACPAALGSKPADIGEHRKLKLIYTGDWFSNRDGGLQEDDRFLYNVDLYTRIQLSGTGSLYIHGSYNNGEAFSGDVVGDAQVVSNIEADNATRLYQLYYEQGSEERGTGFLVGLWDLNSRLDVIGPAGLFINSSHGIGAEYALSGDRGPSIFPVTSLALYGHHSLSPRLKLRGAILDGVPGDPDKPHRSDIKLSRDDGALLALEAEYTIDGDRVAKAGAWHYTSDRERLDGGSSDEYANGIYASLSGSLVPGHLSGWIRYGVAADKVQEIGSYFGTGVVLEHLPGALDDSLGLAVASAFASDAFRDQGASRVETSVELTYSVQVTPWLRLQPDLQYVFNPGLEESRDDALVIGCRIELKTGLHW